jgi:archaellum biogenesis ATPase FlaH
MSSHGRVDPGVDARNATKGEVAGGDAADDRSADRVPDGATAPTLRRLDVARLIREQPSGPPWVVTSLVVRGMLTILNGREGEGKSLLAGALAAGVATGTAEAGMSCTRGGVLVIDAENGEHEIHRRVHALGLPSENIEIYEADGFDLRRQMAELETALQRHRPALLVLDSFRSLWRGEENDSREIAAVLDPLRNLVRRYRAGTLLLHHSGKGEDAGYRGSSAIGASAELGFRLKRRQNDPDRARRCLECWKCRPAAEPPHRWLVLCVEAGQVYINRADSPNEDEPRPTGPVRCELRPRVRAVLTQTPQPRAAIARAVGRDARDRSVGRVLDDLRADGEAEKVGPDARPEWKVATEATPTGSCHVPPSVVVPHPQAEDAGGTPSSMAREPATSDADAREPDKPLASDEDREDGLPGKDSLVGGAW